MLWLPERVESHVIGRLPLADCSAAALLSAIVGDSSGKATEIVRDAVKQDAALALWAVCAAECAGCGPLRSVETVTCWLVSNSRHALLWPLGAEQTPDDAAWCGGYRRLAAISTSVAQRASQLAADQAEVAEHAFLLGLLHAAGQWHALDPAAAQGAEARRALPAWLADSLHRLSQSAAKESEPVVSCVARARDSLDEAAALADYQASAASSAWISAALSAASRSLPAVTRAFWDFRAGMDFAASVEAEKLSAMAEFAAGAGHEINNPIAVIAGRAQLLLADEVSPQRRHELAVIHSQAMRVYEMIADMMLFARPPAPKLGRCDLNALVCDIVDETRAKAAERRVKLNATAPDGPIFVQADATQIAVAVRAICDNALAATSSGGLVLIRVRMAEKKGPKGLDEAVVEISDNGHGISDDVRRHLFDPFYSGRQAGRGLGMGLAKAWRIVTNHRGRIEVSSPSGQGTTFSLAFPWAGPRLPT